MPIIKRNKSTIYGLNDTLATMASDLVTESETRAANDGDLTTLKTQVKGSLTAAINEVVGITENISETRLRKDQNLSDVDDVAVARTNLDVLSTQEIADRITQAKLALGTNYTVETNAERDELTDLDLADRVFVRDVGDGTWAVMAPAMYDEATGSTLDWIVLYTQSSLENSISATGVKEAYESNDDTNAYTDEAKGKVDNITVTDAVDLDDAVYKAELEQDLNTSAPTDNAPSAAAVKAYAQGAVAAGGALPIMESLAVTGDTITLTNTPRGGINGILNFGTVRYMDENNSAWDAPVIATADPKVFLVSADSEGQWVGKNVKIQYVFSSEPT